MVNDERDQISRRNLLKGAGVAVGAGVVMAFASLPIGASAATKDATPDAAGIAQTRSKGITNLAGVHAEYRDAISSFPFDLPPGVSFPPESNLRDSTPGENWEIGNGRAEAYMFWHSATVAAAVAARDGGDPKESDRLLSMLNDGFNSKTRADIWIDPDESFQSALREARKGNANDLLRL